MIDINGISKQYGKNVALSDVHLSIGDKECFTLLGANGAGKTTLINILTTTLKASSGSATINGFDIVRDKQKVREIINISPQEIAVVKNLTVRENLELIADLYSISDKENKISEAITLFNLEEKRDTLTKKLSGGQLKRLSIALATITSPDVLFLDEPTLGLDVKSRRALWEKIKDLKSRMTIFLTTHYLDEVEYLTDRVAVISKGVIKAVGTVEQLKLSTDSQTLEDAFLKIVGDEE